MKYFMKRNENSNYYKGEIDNKLFTIKRKGSP